ncbi:MAG TPA: response regulator transcription factor [Opitutaceae bacterium]|nr:response regulator transcription factor [Opitutaceae bacterium]
MSPPAKPIRVLIVDDSEVVRAGLRSLLGTYAVLSIVGEAATAASAVTQAARLKPHVVLLDVRLPDGSGCDVCRKILQQQSDTRVVMLTSTLDDHAIYDSIQSGACGYLLKEIDAQSLVDAVTNAAAGKAILDSTVTSRVLGLVKANRPTPKEEKLAALSTQERRVLALIAKGHTNKEAGVELSLSEKTVKNYLSNVFDKLQVGRRAQAAALYAQLSDTSRDFRP